MSSVEIKIKGIKDIKGLSKMKRKGKAQRKKKALIERKRGAEYSFTKMTPRIIPTYIDRPPPQIDYRPIFDKLTNLGTTGLKLFLSQQKSLDNVESRNIGRPAIVREASSMPNVSYIMDDEEKKQLQNKLDVERENSREAMEEMAVEKAKVLDLEEGVKSFSNIQQETKIKRSRTKKTL